MLTHAVGSGYVEMSMQGLIEGFPCHRTTAHRIATFHFGMEKLAYQPLEQTVEFARQLAAMLESANVPGKSKLPFV